ncbi:hypothetical protein KSS87_014455 [Heliosperma pusillum]|nr:hypothetical protein KSS87_014455 [Heliosperma pusillum]
MITDASSFTNLYHPPFLPLNRSDRLHKTTNIFTFVYFVRAMMRTMNKSGVSDDGVGDTPARDMLGN